MALQPNTNVSVRYAAESTFGTQAPGPGQVLRRIQSSLNLGKDAFSSNEVRVDQQVYDVRHGVRRAAGSLSGELSTQSYDDWMEASMRGTWTAGLSITQATAAMSSATLASTTGALTGTLTASAGSFITAGLKRGDVVRLTGLAGNINKNFRILAISALSLTVYPAPVTVSAQTTWTIAVQGKKLLTGTALRSFTIEQFYPDIDISELFLGMRVGQMDISLPPTGMATANFGFQGQNMLDSSGASAPVYASPTAAVATGIMAGVSGSVSINGSPIAILTQLDFSVNNNLNTAPVVGAVTVPDIFYGRTVITGNVSAYLADTTLMDYFLNETEISLDAELDDSQSPANFLCFRFNRIKLTGISKTVGPDGGVIVQFPFQSLLSVGIAGTDDSALVIQRSN